MKEYRNYDEIPQDVFADTIKDIAAEDIQGYTGNLRIARYMGSNQRGIQ
jgi:hypothetical protein